MLTSLPQELSHIGSDFLYRITLRQFGLQIQYCGNSPALPPLG